jgi:hypothetical protein
VVVATMIRSTSAGVRPALARAILAASTAKSEQPCSGAARRRSWMPVRSTIQSWLVSTTFDRASLVTTSSGR